MTTSKNTRNLYTEEQAGNRRHSQNEFSDQTPDKKEQQMKKLLSCALGMDSGHVGLKSSSSSLPASNCTAYYSSPLGELLLTAEGDSLTGLYFAEEKGKHRGETKPLICGGPEGGLSVIEETKRWLESYFAGKEPDFLPNYRLSGTPFQLTVWKLLERIPYGRTLSYGELAAVIAAKQGIPRMAAQAVGGAVGRNPISIIVPCHRVIGSDGRLVGYGGGLEKKIKLLSLERVWGFS